MWSSTEEEGFPFTVRKLQGCLQKPTSKSQVLRTSEPVAEAQPRQIATSGQPSPPFGGDRPPGGASRLRRTGAFLCQRWASSPPGSPAVGSPRASSTPLWQEPRYESQTNKPADPHATRQAQLGPEASAPVPLGKQGHRFQGRKVLSRLPRRSARGRPRRACAPAAPGAALASGKEETRLAPHGGQRRKRVSPPKRAVRQEGFLTHFCLPPAPMPATA